MDKVMLFLVRRNNDGYVANGVPFGKLLLYGPCTPRGASEVFHLRGHMAKVPDV